MITWDGIEEANRNMKRMDIKGKEYAAVPERVQAFRKMCPEGSIVTEIISIADGICIMKATVANESGQVLATGTAFEKADASFINKTSYIENCETSAVGRALGMLGFGSEASMASAEEVVNAVNQQSGYSKPAVKKEAPKKETPKREEKPKQEEKKTVEGAKNILDDKLVGILNDLCKKANVNPAQLMERCHVNDFHQMSMAQYVAYSKWMEGVIGKAQ